MGKRLAAWVLGVAIAVSMLDIGATYLALRRGIGVETNPMALAAMRSVGVVPTLAGGLVVRVTLVALLALIGTAGGYRIARRAASLVLTAVTMWWALIACNAVVVIAGVRA
jgi:hypothetical protein